MAAKIPACAVFFSRTVTEGPQPIRWTSSAEPLRAGLLKGNSSARAH